MFRFTRTYFRKQPFVRVSLSWNSREFIEYVRDKNVEIMITACQHSNISINFLALTEDIFIGTNTFQCSTEQTCRDRERKKCLAEAVLYLVE